MLKFLETHSKIIGSVLVLLLFWLWYSAGQGGGIVPMPLGTRNLAMNSKMMAAPAMDMDYMAEEAYAEDGFVEPLSSDYYPEEERKIVTTANYTIEVENPEESAKEVRDYLKSINGFLDNMNISEYSQKKKSANLTMRVPADSFDETIETIKSYGYVKSENISSRDMSSQYYDNTERITNLEAREAKIREFFDQAKNVEETMSVYNELSNIREQIERLKGSQKNIDRQADYSTIYLNLVPDIEIDPISDDEWNIWRSFKKQVNSLINNLQGLADFAIFLIVKAVIWIPLGLIVFLIWRFIKKQRKS